MQYTWSFYNNCVISASITGAILCEKDVQLATKMKRNAYFGVNNGWLKTFKRRRVIRLLNNQGENLSANAENAEGFKEYIQNMILKKRYSNDYIYNADESRLFWRILDPY